MNSFEALGLLAQRCSVTPTFASWEQAIGAGLFDVRITDDTDIVASALNVVEDSERAVPCGLCGGNVREHDVVGWLELDYGPDLDTRGWDRFCPPCYAVLVADMPPNGTDWPEGIWPAILTAIRLWPKTRGSIAYTNAPYGRTSS